MHGEDRRLARQHLPVADLGRLDRVDGGLRRHRHHLHRRHVLGHRAEAVDVLLNHQDVLGHTVDHDRPGHHHGHCHRWRRRRGPRGGHVVTPHVVVPSAVPRRHRRWSMGRKTALEIDPGAIVAATRQGQHDLGLLEDGVGDPDLLVRAHQPGQAGHHVVLDVAMEQEVGTQLDQAGILRRAALQRFEFTGQAQRGRHLGVDHEGFDRAQGVHVARTHRRVRQLPTRRMRVEVVPRTADVEVEQIPPNRLADPPFDGRRVTDEGAPVQAKGLLATTAGEHDVLVGAIVDPSHRGACGDRDVGRVEAVVLDADFMGQCFRNSGNDAHAPGHAGPVDPADVVGDDARRRERVVERVARGQQPALEALAGAGLRHRVDEQRHLVIDTRRTRVANDQATEQAAVDVALNVTHVVVKRPGADHRIADVEDVSPALPGQNLVAATAVPAGHATRPCTIGFDAVVQAVHMKAVAIVRVAIANVNVQLFARSGPDDGARNPMVPRRLGAVGRHQRVGLRRQVVRVEVLAIDQCVDARFEYFLGGNAPEFMPLVALAIAPVAARAQQRRQRAVAGQRLDLEKDVAPVAAAHEDLPASALAMDRLWSPRRAASIPNFVRRVAAGGRPKKDKRVSTSSRADPRL